MIKYSLDGTIYTTWKKLPFKGEFELKEENKVQGTLVKEPLYAKIIGKYSETKNSKKITFSKFPLVFEENYAQKLELIKRTWLEDKIDFKGEYLGTIYFEKGKIRTKGSKIIIPKQYAVNAEIRKM